MSPQNPVLVNHEKFVARHMAPTAGAFAAPANPLQLYPLSMAASLIQCPTPLFRAEYSFLLLFQAGGGHQQVDHEMLELAANDVLFIREGHLNAIKSIEAGTEGYFIHIDSPLLPRIFEDRALLHRLTFHPRHAVSRADMEWLFQCCALVSAQARGKAPSQEIQVVLLKALALKLGQAAATTRCQPERQWLIAMSFKELLYTHFITKRDVAFYADSLAVSENYLSRCLTHVTSKPPKQHIQEMVIAQSKLLLQDPSKDIAQVAFELHFSEPAYFGRLFRRLTQQTPTEYRAALRHGLSG